jgi:hypothetical protein
VNLLDSTNRHLAAKPMLLPYPRRYVRRLSCEFSRVKLDSLEARHHPVEQLDKRPPWMAEGRITQDAVIEMPVRAAHASAAKPLLSNIENHNDDAAKRAFKFPKNRTCCNNATSMHLMIC